MRTSPRPILLLTVVCIGALAGATAITGAQQSSSPRERALFVSAVDKDGEPVTGLGPDAFVVREDGARREVLRVSRATEPIDIALLVDNSTAASDEITFFRDSLSKFVATMAAGNNIAVITLADRPTIALDYTNDPKRLSDAVGRLFPMPQSGMTLLDAIVETSQGLARRETPRAVMVPIITDGIEFTNRYSKDVVAALERVDVALHAVTIGQFSYSEDHGIRERLFLLSDGTAKSGGQQITLLSPHGLDPALQRLARELSSQYKVIYGRPQSLIPPERTEVTSAKPGLKMRGAPARGESGA
jgi:VWFA-related protein